MGEVLNSLERTQLRTAEAVIEKNLGAFMVVGAALAEIRDNRLYRESYKSFSDYVSQRWDIRPRYAYRIIEAASVAQTIAEKLEPEQKAGKLSEWQLRPLVSLPPEQQADAIETVVKKASEENQPITASLVNEAVKAVRRETADEDDDQDGLSGLSARVLNAIVTEQLKPTDGQREKLEQLSPEEQEAILESVLAGRQTLRQALEEGPADPGPEEVGKRRAMEIDAACRELTRIVNEELSKQDPWIEEKRGLIEADLRTIKKTLCSCKATYICPSCRGQGCASCKETGRVNRYTLDRLN